MLHRLSLLDQLHELPGGAVHDRGLAGVHLDQEVVDPAATEGTEDMLDSVDLGVSLLDGGGAHQVRDQVDPGLDLGVAVEVRPLEHDTVVHGGGLEGHVHGVPGMQGIALDGDLVQKGALLHGCDGGVSETPWK